MRWVWIVLIVLVLVTVGQGVAQDERYIHAVLIWDNSEDTPGYTWNMSNLYGDLGVDSDQLTLDLQLEVVSNLEGVGLVDYFAVYGSEGYRLASTVNLFGSMLFIFEKPIR